MNAAKAAALVAERNKVNLDSYLKEISELIHTTTSCCIIINTPNTENTTAFLVSHLENLGYTVTRDKHIDFRDYWDRLVITF